MELVLQQNYVEIEQEEMEYLDGGVSLGKHWWNNRGNIAKAIDVALIVIGVGVSAYQGYALKKYLKDNGRKWAKTVTPVVMKYVGISIGSALSTVINIALTLVGTSIGGLIAYGLDVVDGRLDGYIYA